jgi:hypothetical protein
MSSEPIYYLEVHDQIHDPAALTLVKQPLFSQWARNWDSSRAPMDIVTDLKVSSPAGRRVQSLVTNKSHIGINYL